ncbi:hypothetical protein [uncultured Campylobacter sp.]|mgnify:CR=1 FL=1|uniref:hypothetical protein n=1 Tax=uncultured Campylobacter sp. TaxID=218934 RepID=UPI0026281477|nr:hypothetical protein [uncultured Campylobacter sp.]
MLSNTQKKVFDATISNLTSNKELESILGSDAVRKFLVLLSIKYEEFLISAQDENASDESRLRAMDKVKLIESFFEFFENYTGE